MGTFLFLPIHITCPWSNVLPTRERWHMYQYNSMSPINSFFYHHIIKWVTFWVMKSCILWSSTMSDIILSPLSVNSEVPVKLNLAWEDWDGCDFSFWGGLDFLEILLRLPPLPMLHGNWRTPPFCMHFVWKNNLQSVNETD